MLNLLRQACSNGGRLRCVRENLLTPNSPLTTAIELQFDTLTITISAVMEDDTISIIPTSIENGSYATSGPPWSLSIGKPLQWAWLMTNQQGYTDGLRLEFKDPDDSASVVVELIVAASSLHAYQAKLAGV
jgi:hypothetical protein